MSTSPSKGGPHGASSGKVGSGGSGDATAASSEGKPGTSAEHGHVAIATITPEGHPRADGWNLRDIATVDAGRIRPGLVFRSSQVFNKEAVARLKIRSAVDLRKADRSQRKAAMHGEQPHDPLADLGKAAKAAGEKLAAELPLGGNAHQGFEVAVGADTLQDYGLQVYHAELLPKRAQLSIFLSVPRRYKWRTIKAALTGHSPQAVMAPVVADPQSFGLAKLYCLMLDMSKPYIKRALEVFAYADNLPCVMHCVHGKDRTGLLAALLLLLLGVDEAAVIEDYVASEVNLKEGRASVEEKGEIESHMVTDTVIASPAEVMQETLQHLHDRYGGVDGYLKAPGLAASIRARCMMQAVTLTPDKVAAIRRNLLTPEAFAAIHTHGKKRAGVRRLAKRMSDVGRLRGSGDGGAASEGAPDAGFADAGGGSSRAAAASAASAVDSRDSSSVGSACTGGGGGAAATTGSGDNTAAPSSSAAASREAGEAGSTGGGSGARVAVGSSFAMAGARSSAILR